MYTSSDFYDTVAVPSNAVSLEIKESGENTVRYKVFISALTPALIPEMAFGEGRIAHKRTDCHLDVIRILRKLQLAGNKNPIKL